MRTPRRPPRPGRLAGSVLGLRDFRLLWLGQSISAIGDMIFPVAIAVRVLDEGGSAGDLGLVLAARSLSLVLFVVVGGVVADRLRRTRVMVGADVLRAAAALVLAVSPGDLSVMSLAAVTFVIGSGEAFFRPAYGAIVPSVVPADRLAAANGVTSVALNSAHIIGPAIAGVLVATVGWRTAFAVDGLTFLVSLATLVRIQEPAVVRTGERTSAVRDALAGIRAVRERPWILAVLLYFSVHLMVSLAPVIVLRPVIVADRFGDRALLGVLLAAFGAGAVVGGVLATRWRPRRAGVAAMCGLLPLAATMLALAYSPYLWLVVLAEFLGGIGIEVFQVNWITAVQRDVPRHLLARVVSLDWMMSLGLMPLGFALTGPVTDAVGEQAVLVVAAAVAVLGLVVLVVPGAAEFRTPGRAEDADGEPFTTLESGVLLSEPGVIPASDGSG
ncbi:MAG TPA: MFS transporter [Mycobacteriales bacterium]|nr:MFS transporter [Mycobacteriales bacterium]